MEEFAFGDRWKAIDDFIDTNRAAIYGYDIDPSLMLYLTRERRSDDLEDDEVRSIYIFHTRYKAQMVGTWRTISDHHTRVPRLASGPGNTHHTP